MDDLAAALRKAAVDSKWLATFEDEELDLRLLRDMKNLSDNLQELSSIRRRVEAIGGSDQSTAGCCTGVCTSC